ncbi:hypothetical protein [Dryocola sp. BD613]|uniref:hypothetical protein n=1 Tax=Dryocola sp. BD613 TaxID=3133272 RepID=UPI003F504901
MKELNAAEIAQVTGAGFIADLTGSIGGVIGSIVDAGAALGGLNTNLKDAATALGKGFGSLLELNFKDAISQIGDGIAGLFGFGSRGPANAQSNKLL